MINRRVAVAVCAMAILGAGEGMQASTVGAVQVPVRAMFGHEKMVHFGVTNATAAPLKLKCGEQVVSVDPGKTTEVKLPVGSKVTFAEVSGEHATGEVLAEVAHELNGTTIAVH